MKKLSETSHARLRSAEHDGYLDDGRIGRTREALREAWRARCKELGWPWIVMRYSSQPEGYVMEFEAPGRSGAHELWKILAVEDAQRCCIRVKPTWVGDDQCAYITGLLNYQPLIDLLLGRASRA